MSTAPTRLVIGVDDQYSAALATAQARVREFGAASGLAGDTMSHSFHEAKGAAALLGEEIGVKLNRHLRSVLASSQLIGPILSAAFPIAAAIGFVEVAEKIPEVLKDWFDKLSGIIELDKQIEEHSKLAETFHKIAEEVGKVRDELEKVGKTSVQIALAAAQEAQFRLISAQLVAGQQESLAKSISKSAKAASGFAFDVPGATGPRRTGEGTTEDDRDMASALKTRAAEARANISLLQAQFEKSLAELNKAIGENSDKLAKSAAIAAKQFYELQFKVRQESTKATASVSSIGNVRFASGDDLINQAGNEAIADRYLARFKALQSVYLATRTPAETLAIEIEKLNTLFGDNRGDIYQRAIEGLKDRYDEARAAVRRFGEEAGDALKQGILMGRSWRDVLDSLVVSVGQLILKMYVLKTLQASSFGSSGIGGFFSSLLSGLTGRAGGGPVYAGSGYMVGEGGPEPFFPSTNGVILPHGSLGGTTINYHIDARGGQMGIEREIVRALQATENRAVARSVATIRENGLRGR